MDSRFRARQIVEEDWPLIATWYERDGDMPPHFDGMPRDSAYIMEFEGKPAACGFLMLTNSKYTIVEGLETNKDLPEITQGRGLRELVWHMCAVSKSLGYWGVFGFPAEDNFSVCNMYKKHFDAVQVGRLRRLIFKAL